MCREKCENYLQMYTQNREYRKRNESKGGVKLEIETQRGCQKKRMWRLTTSAKVSFHLAQNNCNAMNEDQIIV